MSLTINDALLSVYRFPRVSGDEPHACDLAGTGAVFSPRERG